MNRSMILYVVGHVVMLEGYASSAMSGFVDLSGK